MSETPSCPYPWCSSSSFRAGALSSDSAASCATCGSVAARCPEPACGAWNRAFARWCRRCGQGLGESRSVWEGLPTFTPAGGPTGLGPPELVADFSQLDGAPKTRARRVALAAAQGFLALHQAGGFVALARPFGSADQGLAFERREDATDPAAPAAGAHSPTMTPDGRRLLLTDRGGAAVLDLWDTPISADPPSAGALRRFAPPAAIAADPVPLDGSRVGLVLGEPSSYSWLTWDLDSERPEQPAAPLPRIVGGPCEASRASRDVVALATPEGHWVWRVEDARAGAADALVRTWSPAEAAADPNREPIQAEVGRRARNAEAFFNPGQVFKAEDGGFRWYFRATDGQGRSYRVLSEGLKVDDRQEYRDAAPVGVSILPDRPSAAVFERSNALLREREIQGRLTSSHARLPGEGWAGLQLIGDLIVTIGAKQRETGSRRIEIQPVRADRASLHVVSVAGLAADPLIWAGHLFTVERPDPHALILNRRSLSTPREAPR